MAEHNLSTKELDYLKRFVELGKVYCSFGTGHAWSFPKPGTPYVDVVPIDDNDIFRRFIGMGLLEYKIIPWPIGWWDCSPTTKARELLAATQLT